MYVDDNREILPFAYAEDAGLPTYPYAWSHGNINYDDNNADN